MRSAPSCWSPGWLVFAAALWRRRVRIARQSGAPPATATVFALGLGAGLLVASATGDFAYWWVVGATLLVAGQLLAAYLAGAPRG